MSITGIRNERIKRALTQLDNERKKYTQLGKLAKSESKEDFAKSYYEAANDLLLVSSVVENARTESERKLYCEMNEYISSIEALGLQFGNIVKVDGSNLNPYFVTERGFTDCTGAITDFMPGALVDKIFKWKCVGFVPHDVLPEKVGDEVWCTDVLVTEEPVKCYIDSCYVTDDDQVMIILIATVNGINWSGEFLVCDANGQSDIGSDVFMSREEAIRVKVS